MSDLFYNYLPQLLWGTLLTIELLIFSLAVGLLLAILMTGLRLTEKKRYKIPIELFSFFIRGTPLLVQFFLIYYGLAQFEVVRNSFLWSLLSKPFMCAVLALALNTAAYSGELFWGAIKSVPKGEILAGKSFGFSFISLLRIIIFPHAWRRALPAYSNEVIMVLKSTTLASTITLMDLLGVTRSIISETYSAFEFFIIAGAIYLFMNTIIMHVFKVIERRANRYLV